MGPLLERLPALDDFRLLITSDHATPVTLRTHTPDPVPFALCTRDELAAGAAPLKYGEREAVASGVVIAEGHSLVRRLLEYPRG